MLIKTLEEAEQIVSTYKELSWEGWNILETIPNPAGYSSKSGVFVNNKWNMRTRYIIKDGGWHVPSKYKVVT
jgi:hypothetical protein